MASRFVMKKEALTFAKWSFYSIFPVLLGIAITILTFGFWSKATIEKNRTAHKVVGIVLLILGLLSFLWLPVIGPLMLGVGIAMTTFAFMSMDEFEKRRTGTKITGGILLLIGVIGTIRGLLVVGKDTSRMYHEYR